MVMVLSQGMKAYIIVGARMINGRTRPEFQWLSSSGIPMAHLKPLALSSIQDSQVQLQARMILKYSFFITVVLSVWRTEI